MDKKTDLSKTENLASLMNYSKLETLWLKKNNLKKKLKINDERSLRTEMGLDDFQEKIPLEKVENFFEKHGVREVTLLLKIQNKNVEFKDLKSLFKEDLFLETFDRLQRRKRTSKPLGQTDHFIYKDKLSKTLPQDIFSKNVFEVTKEQKYENEARVSNIPEIAAKKVVDKELFANRKNSNLALFRIFDKDCDGFVTKNDFCEILNQKDILSNEEAGKLFDNLKKNDKNFLSLSEFDKQIYSGFGHAHEINSSAPGLNYSQSLKRMVKKARSTRSNQQKRIKASIAKSNKNNF